MIWKLVLFVFGVEQLSANNIDKIGPTILAPFWFLKPTII